MQAYPFLWLPLVVLIGVPILLVSPVLVLIVLMLLLVGLVRGTRRKAVRPRPPPRPDAGESTEPAPDEGSAESPRESA